MEKQKVVMALKRIKENKQFQSMLGDDKSKIKKFLNKIDDEDIDKLISAYQKYKE